jgi:hypothetical protein
MVNALLLQSLQIECPYGEVKPHMGPYRKIIGSGTSALTALWLKEWGLHQGLPPLIGVTSLTLLQVTWGMA